MASWFALTDSRPFAPALATVLVTLAVFTINACQMGLAYFLVIISLCGSAPPSCYHDTFINTDTNLVQRKNQTGDYSTARISYQSHDNLQQPDTSTLTEKTLSEKTEQPIPHLEVQLLAPVHRKQHAREAKHPYNNTDTSNDCLSESDNSSKSLQPHSQTFFPDALDFSSITPSSSCVPYDDIGPGDEDEIAVDGQVEEAGDDFAAVKKAINLKAIKEKAIECRTKQLAASHSQHSIINLSCEIDLEPMCGSYNLVYIIRWSDDVKWVARIPSIGCKFGLLNAAKMNSEYGTMEYIRKNTNLPVPQVFCHSWVPDLAGVPFALLSFVEGKSLYQFWKEDASTTDEQKLTTLSAVAEYMAELSKLRFLKMGSLYFDQFEATPTVGPPIETIWDEVNERNKPGLARQHGTMKEQLAAWVDEAESSIMRGHCTIPLTQMAIESIPGYLTTDGQYTISLADFDLQNIMVDDNGTITGFLDWDGVRIGPIASGAVSYPLWITRDWQTGYGWGYDDPMAEYPEDSPEQLSAYRRHYLKAMTAYQGSDYDPRWTKLSHILARVEHAAENYTDATDDMCILFEYCKIPFQLADYSDSYKVEGGTKEKDEIIKEAFSNMWDTYQETPNQICESHRVDDESDDDEEAEMELDDQDDVVREDEGEVVDTKQEEERHPIDH